MAGDGGPPPSTICHDACLHHRATYDFGPFGNLPVIRRHYYFNVVTKSNTKYYTSKLHHAVIR